MSETQTLGPCTECGTPRDACTAPDYCCEECLHFPPGWDGYAPPQDAEPTDVREQIARAIHAADEIVDFPGRTWDGDAEDNREDYRRQADAVLALPAVRDALAAQETVRRARESHYPETIGGDVTPVGMADAVICANRDCGEYWPCLTARALGEQS